MAYSRTRAEELAAATGAPWWIAQAMAELEPVSQGDWTAADGTQWHAEANRVTLEVSRVSRWHIARAGRPQVPAPREQRPGGYDRMLAWLALHPRATVSEICQALDVTRDRALLVLRAARRAGDVRGEPHGPGRLYPVRWSVRQETGTGDGSEP